MATHLYGIGTKFYGKDDVRSDGSFTATKWVVFLFIPLVPLGSFYVRPNVATVTTVLPPITERIGWQKRHIVNVYAFISAIAILFSFVVIRRPFSQTATPSGMPSTRLVKGRALPPDRTNPGYIRPTTAENGSPFPGVSDYIEGYEQLYNDGYGWIAVNNTANTSDLYAKIYSLEEDASTPARVFFVQAEGSFVVKNLDVGRYELRYRDLDTGGIAKTEPLILEDKIEDGVPYSKGVEVILDKVVNGNLETEPISEEDF